MAKVTKNEIQKMCELYNINIENCLLDIDAINMICGNYKHMSEKNKKNISNLINKAETLIKEKGIS